MPVERNQPAVLSKRVRTAVSVAMVISIAPSVSLALTCPVAHPSGHEGVLRETHATIDRLSTDLRSEDLEGAPDLIADLRARHPTASDGAILNYLITAYCPAVSRRTDLSETQKTAEMDRVSGALSKLLFSRGSRKPN